MTLRVVPEGLADAGVGAGTLIACRAPAPGVPLAIALVPPEFDPVPLQSVIAFCVRGGERTAAQGAEHLGRSGVGAGESSTSYLTDHAAAPSAHSIAGRWL